MAEGFSDIIVAVIGGVVTIVVSILAPILTSQNKIAKQLSDHIREDEKDKAENWRVRILAFDDKLCDPEKPYPKQASFEQAMLDCDKYDKYIESHPEFPNGIGEAAIKHIKDTFADVRANDLYGKKK